MNRTLVILALVGSLACLVVGQIPIPKGRLGYVYNGGSSEARVYLDIHMGPLCPDSRDALPTAKMVATHYGANMLRLDLHMFPLPYHHHSFYTAMGARSVMKLQSITGAYRWFDAIYGNLDKLGNDATVNMTTTQVLGLLADYASQAGADRQQFLATMDMRETDTDTRGAWKYSCSRGVSGTPTYFLNDVPIAADPTWSLEDWKKVIDPLLTSPSDETDNQTCPIFEKKCEYLPHKVECCKKGENCIPNVGCRCLGNDCQDKPQKTCSSDTVKCEYLPGKVECCTKGENCIPNVGCRCCRPEGPIY